jgi:uncharacterized membrane protein YczE
VRLPWWLTPHRTIPVTTWRSEHLWKAKPATVVVLVIGLWLFGTGEALLIKSTLGVSPWTVFAQGVSVQTSFSIGFSTFLTSVMVLLFWIPLKQKLGLGTVLNAIVIALAIDVMLAVLPTSKNLFINFSEVLLGVLLVGLGSGLYLTCNVGPGPRDGWMTGIHRKTGISVGRVRLAIEVFVLSIGWILGGTVGVGTLLFAVLVGYSVSVWLNIVKKLNS